MVECTFVNVGQKAPYLAHCTWLRATFGRLIPPLHLLLAVYLLLASVRWARSHRRSDLQTTLWLSWWLIRLLLVSGGLEETESWLDLFCVNRSIVMEDCALVYCG